MRIKDSLFIVLMAFLMATLIIFIAGCSHDPAFDRPSALEQPDHQRTQEQWSVQKADQGVLEQNIVGDWYY